MNLLLLHLCICHFLCGHVSLPSSLCISPCDLVFDSFYIRTNKIVCVNGTVTILQTEPKTEIISRESSPLNEECKLCTLTKPKTDIISRESSPLNEECKLCTLTKPKTDIISRESSPLNEECKLNRYNQQRIIAFK